MASSLQRGRRGRIIRDHGSARKARDRTSGSLAITDRMIVRLEGALAGITSPTLPALRRTALREALPCLRAHPAMALPVSAAETVLAFLSGAEARGWAGGAARDAALAALDGFRRARMRAAMGAARHAASALAGASRIVTLSQSDAVLLTLLRLDPGRGREVWVAESRPAREGLRAATAYGAAGFRVRVFDDALLASAGTMADAIVVGADRLACVGFANKSGTLALSLAARAAKRPFVVVAESAKFFPERVAPIILPGWTDARPRRWSPVFEWIPYGRGMKIVTEAGVANASTMARQRRARLDGGLSRLLAAIADRHATAPPLSPGCRRSSR